MWTLIQNFVEVEYDEPVSLPWTRRMMTLLKSRHVHKRAKVQYEVRTHTVRMNINNITGSSASVFLEYIQVTLHYLLLSQLEFELCWCAVFF